jgi:hypothetical protein
LWKHDSAHVIVVAVHPNSITYEFLSGGQNVTQSLDVFLAVFKRLRRWHKPRWGTMSTFWTVRTRYGAFFIIPSGGRFEVRFEDEVLGSYHSLASALDNLLSG